MDQNRASPKSLEFAESVVFRIDPMACRRSERTTSRLLNSSPPPAYLRSPNREIKSL